MILSRSGLSAGFRRTGGIGARSRIASKMTADVAPEKAGRPVAISYSTRPREKRSLRPSSALPRACSGDM